MERIRVLIVDDSAFARKVLSEMLRRSPRIQLVGTAYDGIDALNKIQDLKPDVVTLDLMMPVLNGVGVLEALPREGSPRVLVITTSAADSELALAALEAGAVDLIHKPTALATEQLYEISEEFAAKIEAAYQARPALDGRTTVQPVVVHAPRSAIEIVVIGTSTGGPPALTDLLAVLPADFSVPIAIVCHMPVGFTSGLAERLNSISPLNVVEASERLEVRAGMAVIARAGQHLLVERSEKSAICHLSNEGTSSHRPSVDVLFESAARAFGSGVLACVLTGMGDDGLIGSGAIHAAGGQILTEAKSTCIVHGMPRCVLEAGLSDLDLPRGSIAAEIVRRL